MTAPSETRRWVAGVDGCRAGWAVIWRAVDASAEPILEIVADFAAILASPRDPAIVAVDMPIGLPERTGPGGRGPEKAVRPHLGARRSSVFAVPSRAAVMATDYREACGLALATSEPRRGVSKQCFHLFPKIREIDTLMTPALESRVYECHPELAFWQLAGGRPMALPKKVKSRPHPPGLAERRALLAAAGYDDAFFDQRRRGAGADDIIDAAALALVAGRIMRGDAACFPPEPERDIKGLRMAIWA